MLSPKSISRKLAEIIADGVWTEEEIERRVRKFLGERRKWVVRFAAQLCGEFAARRSNKGEIERFLRSIIVTPVMHKVHHSRWQPETDSNFAAIFSFWDRLFWTFRLRKDPRQIRLGLNDSMPVELENFRAILLSPIRERTDGVGRESRNQSEGN